MLSSLRGGTTSNVKQFSDSKMDQFRQVDFDIVREEEERPKQDQSSPFVQVFQMIMKNVGGSWFRVEEKLNKSCEEKALEEEAALA
mmetsp:Transcript_14243/g.10301  ORF Transcript_14243/g.10301 Transcript_14243/m.10301 type:complete len:86 (+) Transcript_14243:4-261(+)